jgi:hypothetical protein
VEGVRALAIDKDNKPAWRPSSISQVSREMIQSFFASPWPRRIHPLRELN